MRNKGKTNYLKNRLSEVAPLFVVDLRNEYGHLKCFRSYQEFVMFLIKYFSNGHRTERIQYRFALSSLNDYMKIFFLFSQFSNCTIVIDEADAIFSDRRMSGCLTDVFLGSRNNNVAMVFVAKRPFLLPILIRSQADEFIIFGTDEERDIQYLEGRIRKQFPKPPHTLVQGEAIYSMEGEPIKLLKVPKFKESET